MKNFFCTKIISCVLVLSFLTSAVIMSFPQKTSANVVESIEVGPNLFQSIMNTINTTASSIATYTVQYKETILDPIGWYIAKAIIRQLTTSIVDWINSGFDGNPSFIGDPAGFFVDIADQEIGKFIEGSSDLNFLCQPFSIDIRIALAFRYSPFKKKITCTFSSVIKNAQNAGNNFNNSFIKGNFQDGGWKNWISLTTEPQNNYIGAYIQAEEELALRVGNKSASLNMELGWGKGFMSWKKCVAYASNDSTSSNFVGPRAAGTDAGEADFTGPLPEAKPKETGKKSECVREETQTPGTVIESGLENVLGSGVRQLELADEFNEIVNALFAQLLQTVLSSAGGLRGTSGQGSFDSNAYINRMNTELGAEETQALANIKNDAQKGIDNNIASETTFRTNKQTALNAAIDAKNKFGEVQVCYQDKLDKPQTPALTASDRETALARINEMGTIVTNSINPVTAPLVKDIADADKLLADLNRWKTAITNAKTINDTSKPTAEYNTAFVNRVFHETPAIVQSGADKDATVAQMTTLKNTATAKLNECRAFPFNRTTTN